ncbi:MAG TPA: hypothetical protein VF604_14785 [Pyrinomonadaceae bacterium]|jgi:hypothetical protein
MYCSACGSEVQEGLRYCNRCGANLAPAAEASAPPKLFSIIMILTAAAVLVGVAGLAAIFFFAIEFMSRGNIPAETVVFLLAFTLVVFGIDALLIRQLSRALGVYLKTGGAPPTEKPKLNKAQPVAGELTGQKQDFISAQSPHQTASQKSEQTTRILQGEEPATRKLETGE